MVVSALVEFCFWLPKSDRFNLLFNLKYNKNMEKKNYEFKAYDSKWKEIKLCSGKCIYELYKEEAFGVQLDILIRLSTKYKDPQVRFREV